MITCSLHTRLEIVPGDLADYKRLAAYHYRDGHPGAIQTVFVLKPKRPIGCLGAKPAGVIVYTMPNPRVELRTVATQGMFANLDRQTELALINRNIRCIARLIIEPRFRGIGLATRLVRETMTKANVPIVEALGVMPRINPFLERAGMQAFAPRMPVAHVELVEAFSAVGIEANQLIDPRSVQKHIEALDRSGAGFLETRIEHFLKSHGTRRTMPPNLERTRYILGKLTHRPAYYIWLNPNLEVTMP
jgi:GNAT superfamily N-acetyltransferase